MIWHSCTQYGFSAVFTHMRKINLTYPIPTHWKDKKRTAPSRKTSEVIVALNRRYHIISISVYSAWNFWEYVILLLNVEQENEYIIHVRMVEQSVPQNHHLPSLGKPHDSKWRSSGRIFFLSHSHTHYVFLYSRSSRTKVKNGAVTCDFHQWGLLTSVDSGEPVQPPLKLRNYKLCSVNSLTLI